MIFVDAGTTWAKVIAINDCNESLGALKQYHIETVDNFEKFIVPSKILKSSKLKFSGATGHMSKVNLNHENNYLNEVIALSKGFLAKTNGDGLVLDLGSRDVKWVNFKQGKFSDLDWNSSCASATGATVEMLLKFYDVDVDDLSVADEKYNITCGIFGLEKIMDDVANGEEPKVAISKFIHGLAYNVWSFSKKTDNLYLSGGFCDNSCFVKSLQKYTNVTVLGRFLLVEGLISEFYNN